MMDVREVMDNIGRLSQMATVSAARAEMARISGNTEGYEMHVSEVSGYSDLVNLFRRPEFSCRVEDVRDPYSNSSD